jgi:ribosome-binding factor A
MSRRTERVASLIQREIGGVILQELTDVRIGFVTISRVEVTTDMAFAKVHVSVMGTDKQKRDSMAGLSHSASFLRTHLAKVMKMRTVPRIQFVEDKNLDHGLRINEILNEIKPKPAPAPADDESDSDSDEE